MQSLIEQLLEQDKIFIQMNESNRVCIKKGILRELSSIEHKNMYTINLNKEEYLTLDVPEYLKNMLEGQKSNEKHVAQHASFVEHIKKNETICRG